MIREIKRQAMQWFMRYIEAKELSKFRPSFRCVAVACLKNYLHDRRLIIHMEAL